MNGFDRIVDTLAQYEVDNEPLATALLNLYIQMAGEKLVEVEKAKANIYESILNQQLVKPEHYKLVYKLMSDAKEKLK